MLDQSAQHYLDTKFKQIQNVIKTSVRELKQDSNASSTKEEK